MIGGPMQTNLRHRIGSCVRRVANARMVLRMLPVHTSARRRGRAFTTVVVVVVVKADIADDPSHRCRSTPLETCAVVVDSVVGAVVVIRPRRPDPHPVADRSTGAHILRAIVPPERSAR